MKAHIDDHFLALHANVNGYRRFRIRLCLRCEQAEQRQRDRAQTARARTIIDCNRQFIGVCLILIRTCLPAAVGKHYRIMIFLKLLRLYLVEDTNSRLARQVAGA
ncbi:MAG: hypothetical protein MUP61_07815, partial [Burkholderiales bacterium]|nr:hypothetical protein [Burkholderiales bacterium]